MTDRELIRKVHRGDKESLNKIIEKYYDDVYRFCVYLTGDKTNSYDITQEVFLRFIRYVDSYQYKNLKGYLLIIARNLSRDYLKHPKESAPIDDAEILKTETLKYEDKALSDTETKIALAELLQTLPPKQREVVILRTYGDLKFNDIAKSLGLNISTVKSRYRLGIEHIRKELEKNEEF